MVFSAARAGPRAGLGRGSPDVMKTLSLFVLCVFVRSGVAQEWAPPQMPMPLPPPMMSNFAASPESLPPLPEMQPLPPMPSQMLGLLSAGTAASTQQTLPGMSSGEMPTMPQLPGMPPSVPQFPGMPSIPAMPQLPDVPAMPQLPGGPPAVLPPGVEMPALPGMNVPTTPFPSFESLSSSAGAQLPMDVYATMTAEEMAAAGPAPDGSVMEGSGFPTLPPLPQLPETKPGAKLSQLAIRKDNALISQEENMLQQEALLVTTQSPMMAALVGSQEKASQDPVLDATLADEGVLPAPTLNLNGNPSPPILGVAAFSGSQLPSLAEFDMSAQRAQQQAAQRAAQAQQLKKLRDAQWAEYNKQLKERAAWNKLPKAQQIAAQRAAYTKLALSKRAAVAAKGRVQAPARRLPQRAVVAALQTQFHPAVPQAAVPMPLAALQTSEAAGEQQRQLALQLQQNAAWSKQYAAYQKQYASRMQQYQTYTEQDQKAAQKRMLTLEEGDMVPLVHSPLNLLKGAALVQTSSHGLASAHEAASLGQQRVSLRKEEQRIKEEELAERQGRVRLDARAAAVSRQEQQVATLQRELIDEQKKIWKVLKHRRGPAKIAAAQQPTAAKQKQQRPPAPPALEASPVQPVKHTALAKGAVTLKVATQADQQPSAAAVQTLRGANKQPASIPLSSLQSSEPMKQQKPAVSLAQFSNTVASEDPSSLAQTSEGATSDMAEGMSNTVGSDLHLVMAANLPPEPDDDDDGVEVADAGGDDEGKAGKSGGGEDSGATAAQDKRGEFADNDDEEQILLQRASSRRKAHHAVRLK